MALTPDAWQTFLKIDARNIKEIGTNGGDTATAAKPRHVDNPAKDNPGQTMSLCLLAGKKRKSDKSEDDDLRSRDCWETKELQPPAGGRPRP